MEAFALFALFAQKYGSYTFNAFRSRVGLMTLGSNYETKVFHLTKDGDLKKLVYRGKIWTKENELVEDVTLTAEDFVGKEDVLALLVAEINTKTREYQEAAASQQQQPQEFPL